MMQLAVTTPIDIEAITTKFETSTIDGTDLIVAGIALVAGFVLGAVVRSSVRRLLMSMRGLQPSTSNMIAQIAGYTIVLMGLVIAMSALGLTFGPVITVLLLVALVAILIGRPLLADLGAGVVLQSRRPVGIGDVLRVGDYEGVIEDIDGRVVHVRTYDGWMVRARNSAVLDDLIVSTAVPDRVRVEFVVGVDYATDLDDAVRVASDALAATVGVHADPAPTALVQEFGESTIDITCWIWVDPATRWQTKDLALRYVKREFDADGIVIAFPQRIVHAAPTRT